MYYIIESEKVRIMKDLVAVIVKNLVHQPEEVSIEEIEQDDNLSIEIRVAADDVGRVIGKKGRIIKAIRTVVKASSVQLDKKVNVDIISE